MFFGNGRWLYVEGRQSGLWMSELRLTLSNAPD
jgi:hypothetical protein